MSVTCAPIPVAVVLAGAGNAGLIHAKRTGRHSDLTAAADGGAEGEGISDHGTTGRRR